MKKLLLIVVLVVILVGAGSFYGGMKYQQSKNSFVRGSGQGLPGGQRVSRNGSNFLVGEVLSKDEKSLTLKTSNNGSNIVFFSDSTKISKTVDGSAGDIEIGKQITVSGQKNPDGSYIASMIQLSPRFASSTSGK